MLESRLIVTSSEFRLNEITERVGRAPDGGHDIGDRSKIRPDHIYDWTLWEVNLPCEQGSHPGTEGLTLAIERLGVALATRVAGLVEDGCKATISVVQELRDMDPDTTGLYLSPEALQWMARARVQLDVDQYVFDTGENES